MKFELNTPSLIDEAKKSRHIIKTDNKILSLILETIGFVIIFYITQYLYAFIGELGAIAAYSAAFGGVNSIDEVTAWNLHIPIVLMSELFLTLGTIWCVRIWQKRKANTLGFVKKHLFRDYAIGLVVGFVMFSVAVGICAITGALSLKPSASFNIGLFIAYCFGWFFQGMGEEVLCRGYYLTSIARKNNIYVAVIINSIAFSVLHIGNSGIDILPLINLTLFGICASVFFLKTGNIWLVSAMHSIWNMVQGNVYGIAVSGEFTGPTIFTSTIKDSLSIINGGDFGLEGGLAVTIVLIITIAVGLIIPSCEKKAA